MEKGDGGTEDYKLKLLPKETVTRIMRQALPKHAKITDEAKETMLKCVTEFMRVVTSEAKGNREKVINPEALLLRLEELRLHQYVEPLLAFYDGASTSGGANLDILDQFVDLIINLDDYPDD